MPAYWEFQWPTVQAIQELGGSGSIDEIVAKVLEREQYTQQQRDALHNGGPQTEIEYRLAWARTYLKGMGILNNSQRGVWSLTDKGRVVDESELPELQNQYLSALRAARKAKEEATQQTKNDLVEESDLEEFDWRDNLLEALMNMTPDAFERLARRLLREAGFVSTTVTGQTGDGGIDGQGVYRVSLLSFPVFFQCKRYRGSVGSSVVRDFRGAMAGRGDKGLLITTGSFTTDARNEATRDGASPVDLIDGHRLCDLLKDYELGVTMQIRQVEDISVDKEFFGIV
jgi:restriction system protein